MKKCIVAWMLALLMLTSTAAVAEDGWIAVYKDFFAKNTMTEFDDAYLADINLDGTPELIAALPRSLVFHTVLNNTIRPMGSLSVPATDSRMTDVNLNLHRTKRAYQWVLTISGENANDAIVELFQNGVDMAMANRFFTSTDGDGQTHYFMNGKEVSLKKFLKQLTAYQTKMGNVIIPAIHSTKGIPVSAQIDALAQAWKKQSVDAIPAKSLTLKPAKLTLEYNDEQALTATVKPASATGKVVWTSSDEKLVTVDELGNLKVVGFEGETTVTASIGKLSKTCKVTVKRPAASEIEVTGIACVKVGETRQLTATVYPLGAHQEVAWTSSDETVARVSETGLVTGLKQGITVITAADQENEYSFVFTVTEADETQTGAVTRRAVLVSGAGDYDDQDIFAYEAMQMRNALQQSAFAGAGRMNTVHIKDCPSAPKVLEIIKEELQDADEDDVSYVYINSHGGEPTADGTYVMYIGTGEYGYQDFITGQELRSALDAVRGKIVVILEPCFSGSVIAKGTNTPADWANGFLKAFAAKPIAKSGELATEKYYVITAASQTQSAYYNPSDKIDGLTLNRYYGSGLMNQSMCEAMGWDSWKGAKMAWLSDVNEDGKITLSELYNYVWPRVRELYYLLGNDNGEEYANTGVQHVQVWPENSDYVIFEK